MSYKQFLKELRKIKKGDWYVRHHGSSQIRLRIGNSSFCPITAVCLRKKNRKYSSADWELAAKDLGLRRSKAGLIVRASDHDDRFISGEVLKVRIDLRRATGLVK